MFRRNGRNGLMKQANTGPLGLSTSQAARSLGVSMGTIRRWSDMGYLQSYRTPGGQRRFSHQQIGQFVGSLQRDLHRESLQRDIDREAARAAV